MVPALQCPDGLSQRPRDMSDIVERLRSEGENATRKHYSLGMWMLCSEAADEIETLRAALAKIRDVVGTSTEAHHIARNALEQDHSIDE